MEQPRFEPQHERCHKREREETEPYEELLHDAKRSPVGCGWSSEGAFSELFCKEDDDAAFAGHDLDPVQEELISDVMKSLADEIKCSSPSIHSNEAHPSVSDAASSVSGSENGDNKESSYNVASNVDLQYLLGATDDELGIPPSPHSPLLGKEEVANGDNGSLPENPISDLFENLRPETEAEGFMQQMCNSDCWYTHEELFNDAVCQDWVARSVNGEVVNESSSLDQTVMPLLEAGVGM